ncbi:hypothetical protein SS50377_21221 [Spironucleus salmonicida]|uniref:Uncharacterized protein n=1 Tax=Spironucleus salmonicida TaxID=348837 RepID=V6LT77_9EUKA|nr:hypothetical protein SS50377_21221 [Spironucleus salmonicida]|eukprot:EST43994.1 hypothetical protein SS50377_16303 [Spironucleus salmonicida]
MLLLFLQLSRFDCFQPNSTLTGNVQTRQLFLIFWPSKTSAAQCDQFDGADATIVLNFPGTPIKAENLNHKFAAQQIVNISLLFTDSEFEDIIGQEQANYTFTLDIVPIQGAVSQIEHTQVNSQQCWKHAQFIYDFTDNFLFQINVEPNLCHVTGAVTVFLEYSDKNGVIYSVPILPKDSIVDGYHTVYNHLATKIFIQSREDLGISQKPLFNKFVTAFEQDKGQVLYLVVYYESIDSNNVLYKQKLQADLIFKTTYESVCMEDVTIDFFMDRTQVTTSFWPSKIIQNCISDETLITQVNIQFYYIDFEIGEQEQFEFNISFHQFQTADGVLFTFIEPRELPRDYQVYGQIYFTFLNEHNDNIHIITFYHSILPTCISNIFYEITKKQFCYLIMYDINEWCILPDKVLNSSIMLVSSPDSAESDQKITYLSFTIQEKLIHNQKRCLNSSYMVDQPFIGQYYDGTFQERLHAFQKDVMKKQVRQSSFYQDIFGKRYVKNIAIANMADTMYYLIPIFFGILCIVLGLITLQIRELR